MDLFYEIIFDILLCSNPEKRPTFGEIIARLKCLQRLVVQKADAEKVQHHCWWKLFHCCYVRVRVCSCARRARGVWGWHSFLFPNLVDGKKQYSTQKEYWIGKCWSIRSGDSTQPISAGGVNRVYIFSMIDCYCTKKCSGGGTYPLNSCRKRKLCLEIHPIIVVFYREQQM